MTARSRTSFPPTLPGRSEPLPQRLGTLVGQEEKILEYSVERSMAAEAATHLLRTLPVEDLTINEPDIGTVIESIIREG